MMSMKNWLVLATTLCMAPLAAAQALGKDVPGASDHVFIKRYAGSWLAGYHKSDWDATQLPASAQIGKDDKLKDLRTVEGKVTQLVYIAPRGRSALEVYRNHEQALSAAGLARKFACETDCASLYFAWAHQVEPLKGMQWADGELTAPDGSGFSLASSLNPEGRMLYGTLKKAGQDVHVLLYTSIAADRISGLTATYLQVVEPKAMTTGQVTVDLKALQSGLQAEGKVALHGLYFDTGKAEIKAESKPQLDAMASLLRAQAGLRVFVVGHTDNAGAFDSNQALSLARAQAVVAALSAAPYRVPADRMLAKGVANISPLANNADEAGRARNRRVELVAQ
jgi:OmpA-OmpF porin, OOP family